jgi:hypothetical protein
MYNKSLGFLGVFAVLLGVGFIELSLEGAYESPKWEPKVAIQQLIDFSKTQKGAKLVSAEPVVLAKTPKLDQAECKRIDFQIRNKAKEDIIFFGDVVKVEGGKSVVYMTKPVTIPVDGVVQGTMSSLFDVKNSEKSTITLNFLGETLGNVQAKIVYDSKTPGYYFSFDPSKFDPKTTKKMYLYPQTGLGGLLANRVIGKTDSGCPVTPKDFKITMS